MYTDPQEKFWMVQWLLLMVMLVCIAERNGLAGVILLVNIGWTAWYWPWKGN